MKTILILGILLLMQGISATTVELEAGKEELNINETIELHLEIDIEKPIGGRLDIYREIEPKRFVVVTTLYRKPAPWECHSCAGGTPLDENLSTDFQFTPTRTGDYYAEANFDGVRKRVNFTVADLTASTSSTTTSTLTSTLTTLSTTTTLDISEKEKSIIDNILSFLYNLVKGLL